MISDVEEAARAAAEEVEKAYYDGWISGFEFGKKHAKEEYHRDNRKKYLANETARLVRTLLTPPVPRDGDAT